MVLGADAGRKVPLSARPPTTDKHLRDAGAAACCMHLAAGCEGPNFTSLPGCFRCSLACMPKGADGAFWVYDAVSKDWCAWAVRMVAAQCHQHDSSTGTLGCYAVLDARLLLQQQLNSTACTFVRGAAGQQSLLLSLLPCPAHPMCSYGPFPEAP